MPNLGVNIDHVATLRQARRGVEPEPVQSERSGFVSSGRSRRAAHAVSAGLQRNRREHRKVQRQDDQSGGLLLKLRACRRTCRSPAARWRSRFP